MPLTDADFLNNLFAEEPLQSDALVSQLESIVERAKAEKQSDQILVLLKKCSVTVGKKRKKARQKSWQELLQRVFAEKERWHSCFKRFDMFDLPLHLPESDRVSWHSLMNSLEKGHAPKYLRNFRHRLVRYYWYLWEKTREKNYAEFMQGTSIQMDFI